MRMFVGMVGVGGLYVMGGGYFPQTLPQALGAASVLMAAVNVVGGFIITRRMLDMFRRMFSSPFCCVNANLDGRLQL
jgi:NAD(P) transhydrogenase